MTKYLPNTYSMRMLAKARYTPEKVIAMGGQISASGFNVVFEQSAPEFIEVAARMNAALVEEPKLRSCAMRISGPPIWNRIHRAALFSDPKDFRPLLLKEIKAINCPTCRSHALTYIESHEVPATDNEACWLYSYFFHDAISEEIGATRLTEPEARLKYAA